MLMRTRSALLCLSLLLGASLVACGSDQADTPAGESSGSNQSAESTEAGQADGGGDSSQGGLCEGYTTGEDGVVRLFCDGPATAEVTIDGKTRSLEGGSCEDAAEGFSVNFGVVSESGTPSEKSEYFGVVLMASAGGGEQQATIAYRLDGESDGALADAPELADDKSTLSVKADTMRGATISATVTCNN